jgi:hypothetical protein
VHVVEGATLRQITDQRRGRALEADLVPPDVGQLARSSLELAHLAFEDSQPGRSAVLGRGLERKLHPEANAEHGHPGCDTLAQQLIETELAQVLHRAGKGAHAGHYQARRGAKPRRLAAHAGVRTDVLERLLDRAAVAHAVVDDGDAHGVLHERAHAVSVPLVLGTPVSVGSTATA